MRRRTLIFLYLLFPFIGLFGQEYQIILQDKTLLLDAYPLSDMGLAERWLPKGTALNAFSVNKKGKTIFVYNDSVYGYFIAGKEMLKSIKSAKLPDWVNKDPSALNRRKGQIIQKIDRHYFVIDSLAKRREFVKDSIARREAFIRDSIAKREAFVRDSIERSKGSVLNGDYQFPFNFNFIMGTTNSYLNTISSYMLETGSPLYNISNTTLGQGRNILIGKYFKTKNTSSYANNSKEFFLAYYLDKQFYIERKYVDLDATNSAYLDSLIQCSEAVKDSFDLRTKFIAHYLCMEEFDRVLDMLKAYSKYPVNVIRWSISDMGEYTEGTGASFEFYNPTKKTIKYIYVTVTGYNPVGDRVSSNSLKCVGPIEPDDGGSYSFDYVWFTDMVEEARITSLKVQYMDGTTRNVTKPMNVVWLNEDYELFERVNKDNIATKNLKGIFE